MNGLTAGLWKRTKKDTLYRAASLITGQKKKKERRGVTIKIKRSEREKGAGGTEGDSQTDRRQ